MIKVVRMIDATTSFMVILAKILWQWLEATLVLTIATLTGAFLALSDNEANTLTTFSINEFREFISTSIVVAAFAVAIAFIFYKTIKYSGGSGNSSLFDMEKPQKHLD